MTKILPSPIRPVRADRCTASTTLSRLIVVDHDLDPDLGNEVHRVFRAAVDLGLPLLAPETLDLARCQTLHPQAGERFADLLELERLDHRHDELHVVHLHFEIVAQDLARRGPRGLAHPS